MPPTVARARSEGTTDAAVADVVARLGAGLCGAPATLVVVFASPAHDPKSVAAGVAAAFPTAVTVGCTSCGEFTDGGNGRHGIAAMAVPAGVVDGAVGTVVDLGDDPAAATRRAVHELEERLGTPLRTLDPECHVGLLLVDPMSCAEELVNDTLGDLAPVLDVVGGSAGDDGARVRTSVWSGDHLSDGGLALVVLQTSGRFRVVKTCSFVPTGRTVQVTAADPRRRTVSTLDGRPAAEVYAGMLGTDVGSLDFALMSGHPLGQVIDGRPWIRSVRAPLPDGGLAFHSRVRPGLRLGLMRPTDLLGDTRQALRTAVDDLDGQATCAVLFNCILRRLEMDARGITDGFVDTFDGLPVVGFHTYGESWMDHMNQTLTGIVFGS